MLRSIINILFLDYFLIKIFTLFIQMEKYKVQQLLGEGSYGSVYLVLNEKGQQFAYKKIQINPFHAEQTQREIQIMNKFKHPHLVRIYEYHFEQDKEFLHIIMEYCEGGDLSNFIKTNKNVPEDTILEILRQIVSAFVVMNANGVIHRDLKPENVLLTKDKKVKIADFGCAKQMGANNQVSYQDPSGENGTYLYASPQQLQMEKYSFKCDVWAAGCIAFLLQYGYHPFAQSSAHNVLSLIIQKTRQSTIAIQQGISPKIATFIYSSLIYEDVERASWREFQLSRIFSPKIANIDKYLEYLKILGPMANMIVKQFWKVHRNFNFPNHQDEIFIYYLIKFSMNNLKMCLRLLKKTESLRYLFQEKAFEAYEPIEKTFNQIKASYLQHEKYFNSVKKSMESKQFFSKFISPFESKRSSPFIDLDKSIRTGYKILSWIKKDIQKSAQKENKLWGWIAKWINFQKWFSFEKQPTLEVMSEPQGDILGLVEQELSSYQNGIQ